MSDADQTREALYSFKPLEFDRLTPEQVQLRAEAFSQSMQSRRTVRHFASDPVPQGVMEHAIAAAGSAPSGANMQPWHFVAIQDPTVKHRIRLAAEAEERKLYEHRASEEWLAALAPLGTDANKPFLDIAPWLIAVFARKYTPGKDGRRLKNYYTPESVGIATGLLITALHQSGLVTLTHTPSPMGFLRDVLQRPSHEKPYLLLVTGYPAAEATVPVIERRSLDDIMSIV